MPSAQWDWGAARAETRRHQKVRALARVERPPPPVKDPLARPRRRRAARIGAVLALIGGAVGLHAMVLGGFFGARALFGGDRQKPPEPPPIQLVVTETVVEPEPEPVVEPEPAPAPEAPKPEPKPKRRPKRRRRAPPPPDPVDVEPAPEPPPKKKVRRVVGLSLGSTAKGGEGPSFAVGNTRMGQTGRTADDPDAETLKGRPRAASSNRRATRAPIGLGGPKLDKPKFAGPKLEPKYPEAFRAQAPKVRIKVRVVIGKRGRVREAEVVAGSPNAAFEEAALATARRQRWVPARRGGEPVEYTLTYSYLFNFSATKEGT